MTTDTDDLASLEAWALSRDWFYRYQLPSGAVTPGPVDLILTLHDARRDMMLRALSERFGDRLSTTDCLDLASHEGFFSFELARRTRSVRGVDVRADSVEAARRMAILQGLTNVEFLHADVRDLTVERVGAADVVLLYGLLYHTEDPIRILRIASELTRDTLLIESQVTALELGGDVEWGHYKSRKTIEGLFYLVADDHHREGGTTAMALIPSVSALRFALGHLGFPNVRVIPPPSDEPEQLARGRRAVIVAHRS
jgi:tRNA (mo5U34)-methyltransferase